MNYRQYDWSPLGCSEDPVPGDPEVVREYAARFRATATQAGDAAQLLRSFAGSGMVSYSVDALLAESTALAGRLTLVESRYVGASGALNSYSPALTNARNRSLDLLHEAEQLKRQEDYARSRSNEMYNHISCMPAGPEFDALVEDYRRNESARSIRRGDIQDAKNTLIQVCRDRDDAADDAADVISTAMNASQLNDTLVDHVQEFFHNLDKWVQEHADVLSAIGNVFSAVGIGLQVASLFFPPLLIVGRIFGGIGALFSVAGAFGTARKTGDWRSFWVEAAFAAVTFGAGKALVGVGKAVIPKATKVVVSTVARASEVAVKAVRRIGASKAAAHTIVSVGKEILQDFVVKPIANWIVHTVIPFQPGRPVQRLPCAPPPCIPQPVMNCQRVIMGAVA